jgi:GTP-binding protein
MLTLKKTVFFKTIVKVSSLQRSIAEVIFSGRSNVGKSSTINALCSQKNLARTSKKPGRTRSINIYSISVGKWIIDLPGYGFANASSQEKNLWSNMIEEYIQRINKKMVYIVVDAFVGPTTLDFDMACWLNKSNIFFKIIANKCDKFPHNIIEDGIMQNKIAEYFGINKIDVFIVSAKKKNGFNKLQADIIKFLC